MTFLGNVKIFAFVLLLFTTFFSVQNNHLNLCECVLDEQQALNNDIYDLN